MSVARINMVDWRSEELFVEKTKNTADADLESYFAFLWYIYAKNVQYIC